MSGIMGKFCHTDWNLLKIKQEYNFCLKCKENNLAKVASSKLVNLVLSVSLSQ